MSFPFVLSFWESLDRLSRKFEARSSTVNMKEKKFGISGSTLKWIAIITMLIDHIGASILTKQLLYMNMHPQAFGGVTAEFVEQFNNLYFVVKPLSYNHFVKVDCVNGVLSLLIIVNE